MKFFSPSKINLFLKILRKRQDGYHDLSSLFQATSLGDYLTFKLHSHDCLTSSSKNLPLDGGNLIIKALELFKNFTGIKENFSILLEKNIFVASGLGGGSSNAATTLYALNYICSTGLSLEELSKLGEQIGADVPFFFSSGRALCQGTGNIIEDKSNSNDLNYLSHFLLIPSAEALFSKSIYSFVKVKQSFTFLNQKSKNILKNFKEKNPIFENDLERPTFSLLPELKRKKQEIAKAYGVKIFLTGSGPTLVVYSEKLNDLLLMEQEIKHSILVKSILKTKDEWYQDANSCINRY